MRPVARVTLVTFACVTLGFGLAACFSPNLGDQPFRCGAGNDCPPGYQCDGAGFCTRPGSMVDARLCTGSGTTCEGDNLVTCAGTGAAVVTVCPAGCDSGISPAACWHLSPSNLDPALCDQPATGPLAITTARKIDTDNCVLNGGVVVTQSTAAPPMCVFKATDFTVADGVTLSFGGARIPVLVATSSARIDGTITVAAVGAVGGPGSSVLDTLSRGGAAGLNTTSGGGGGGDLTDGGKGGGPDSSTGQIPGGHAVGVPELRPLTAGGFGGSGGTPCVTDCPDRPGGGGGGGAIEIVSCAGIVFGANAVVSAGFRFFP